MGHEADALPALPALPGLPALSGDVLDGFDGFDGLAAAGRGDATALQRFLDAGAGTAGSCAGHIFSLTGKYWKYSLPIWKQELNGTPSSQQML